jgi:hypothetical protein
VKEGADMRAINVDEIWGKVALELGYALAKRHHSVEVVGTPPEKRKTVDRNSPIGGFPREIRTA